MTKKLLIVYLIAVLLCGVLAYGIFYAIEPKTYTASQDAQIVIDLSEQTHPYIKMSASSTAAWFYVDSAPTAINVAQKTVDALKLPYTAEKLLSRVSVTRLEKNIWITISAEDENPHTARQIAATFSQFLYEDVGKATEDTLPFREWRVLRQTEMKNNFSQTDVWLGTLVATAAVALLLAVAFVSYTNHVKKKKQEERLRPVREVPRQPYTKRLKRLLIHYPIRVLCLFLIVTVLAYGVLQLCIRPSYTATQRACVFLLEDEIYTTEMVLSSQDFLTAYETYLSHPLLFRYFYYSLPPTLTQYYTEEELRGMYEVSFLPPVGVYEVSFTVKTPEHANLLCAYFINFAFDYLCKELDLGQVKPVGLHPVVTQNEIIWDKVLSVGIGFVGAFLGLMVSDLVLSGTRRRMKRRYLFGTRKPQNTDS